MHGYGDSNEAENERPAPGWSHDGRGCVKVGLGTSLSEAGCAPKCPPINRYAATNSYPQLFHTSCGKRLVLHRKNRDTTGKKVGEKPSSLHIYPHGVSTGTRGPLPHAVVRVARFSTAVHMSYPHVLQRFMNNLAIAFRTWRSYAVGPPVAPSATRLSWTVSTEKCDSFPVQHRPNRSMRHPAQRCFWTSSRERIGKASGRDPRTRTTPAARPAREPRTGIASAMTPKAP
jgi:hypothetical protein